MALNFQYPCPSRVYNPHKDMLTIHTLENASTNHFNVMPTIQMQFNETKNLHEIPLNIFSLLPLLKVKIRLMWSLCCQCVSFFQLLNQWANLHKMVYECNATGSHPEVMLSNFLYSVKTWQMYEIEMWEQQ